MDLNKPFALKLAGTTIMEQKMIQGSKGVAYDILNMMHQILIRHIKEHKVSIYFLAHAAALS